MPALLIGGAARSRLGGVNRSQVEPLGAAFGRADVRLASAEGHPAGRCSFFVMVTVF